MARDVMTIRLHLRRIRVVDVLVDTISQLVVEVESGWGLRSRPSLSAPKEAAMDKRRTPSGSRSVSRSVQHSGSSSGGTSGEWTITPPSSPASTHSFHPIIG